MPSVVICRLFTADDCFRSRGNPRDICGGQSCTGTGFSTFTSVFHCHYHSTCVTVSSFSIISSCQDKGRSLGTLKYTSGNLGAKDEMESSVLVFRSSEWNCCTPDFISCSPKLQFQSHFLQDNSWWYLGSWSKSCWFRSSGLWRCVVWWAAADISQESGAL